MNTSLGGTEVHDLRSEIVGDTRRVFVGHCGRDPQAALIVTDANGLFGLTVDTIRLMQIPALIPPLLVIGIGYPDAENVLDTRAIRSRDLTPTPMDAFVGSGHADDFIGFISAELRPWIAERHPAATRDVTYFGHSLGGLFGAYTLLTAPATFDRYIVSSPSLWWDSEVIFDIERQRATDARLNSAAFFGIGALETDDGRRLEGANLAVGHPAKPPAAHLDMVGDMRRFVARLASRADPTLVLDSQIFEGEFHATVPGAVMSRGLRSFASQSWDTDQS